MSVDKSFLFRALAGMFVLTSTYHLYYLRPMVMSQLHDPHVDVFAESKRGRKVVLLGPHDRYNFGDLLFEKVLSRLLETYLGYKNDKILRGGIVSTNMSSFGGPDIILDMKEIQRLSHSSPDGPFDIIYTGGEAAGCTAKTAASMLRRDELRRQAIERSIYDCAYLFPKELLVSNTRFNSSRKNVAIVNSLGGYPGTRACNVAVESADHVGFRDREPLIPDSAVMTKELFGEDISLLGKKVLKEIFPYGSDRNKYIAVQFTNAFGRKSPKSIAQVLDEVSNRTESTIVFFAAGTAPGHDSYDAYKVVASLMTSPYVIYAKENVWSVVATIAGSEAAIATSLHVRIMAFIYQKPRITWCRDRCDVGKHAHFINLWEASNSRTLVPLNETWVTLERFVGTNPQILQDETMELYHQHVAAYMKSFKSWSQLLDK